jgi:deazaflavin-dependent oxidoreductase (nitroreductase family)
MPRWMLDAQVFLLRRQWMGPMNRQLMVITTTGRKSGKRHTIPIGFVPDGDTLLAFTIGGVSNWYRNVLVNPRATLEVQGRTFDALARDIIDPAELRQVIEVYRKAQPGLFQRFFGAPPDAPEAELAKIPERVKFIRFAPLT